MDRPEVWRLVPSVPDVLASSHGRIMKLPSIGIMPRGGARSYGCTAIKGTWHGARYEVFHKGKTYRVARLVCEAFNGQPPFAEAVCMHLDENARNNRPQNLKWGTQQENLNAAGFLKYCRSRTGDGSPRAKGQKRRAESIA